MKCRTCRGTKALHRCHFDRMFYVFSSDCLPHSLHVLFRQVILWFRRAARAELDWLQRSRSCRERSKTKPRLTQLSQQLCVNKHNPPQNNIKCLIYTFISVLTRLPKFHRGKGSRHLALYVTFFFLYFFVDDVTTWAFFGGFMNDVSAFENGRNCKFRLAEIHYFPAGANKVQMR